MGQLGSSEYERWVVDAIEKEKLKQQHLKVVINHLESEVSNLAQETVNQMEQSMTEVSKRLPIIAHRGGVCIAFEWMYKANISFRKAFRRKKNIQQSWNLKTT